MERRRSSYSFRDAVAGRRRWITWPTGQSADWPGLVHQSWAANIQQTRDSIEKKRNKRTERQNRKLRSFQKVVEKKWNHSYFVQIRCKSFSKSQISKYLLTSISTEVEPEKK